jgi:urea transport system permease protein
MAVVFIAFKPGRSAFKIIDALTGDEASARSPRRRSKSIKRQQQPAPRESGPRLGQPHPDEPQRATCAFQAAGTILRRPSDPENARTVWTRPSPQEDERQRASRAMAQARAASDADFTEASGRRDFEGRSRHVVAARGGRASLGILTVRALASASDESQRPRYRVRHPRRSRTKLAIWAAAQNVWYGMSLGSVLLLAAIGLAITFGVMGVINMAHGEMVMLGAYTTFVVQEIIRNRSPKPVRLVAGDRPAARLRRHRAVGIASSAASSAGSTAGRSKRCSRHGACR